MIDVQQPTAFRAGRSWSAPRLVVAAAACLPLLGLACSSPSEAPQAPRPLRPDTLENNGWDREADLVHLALALEIDFDAQAVEGRATNRLRALRPGVDEIRLHGIDLDVRRITDGEGRRLKHRVESPFLYVQLAAPLALHEEVMLAIDYRATPKTGLHFEETDGEGGARHPQAWTLGQNEDNRHWFPSWDFPNDRCTFEAAFRVPAGSSAISNGRLVEVESHEDGDRTYHWRMEQSLVTYLVALAAGPWERYEDRFGDLPLEYYVPPGTGAEKVRRAFAETPEMMAFFGERLDHPYPYDKYAQVCVKNFDWGGMENTTLTVLNDYLIGEAGAVDDLDGDPRLLVAHELAHHWFGDLVTCFGWSHLWLNEAWASFMELQFEEHVTGEETMRLWFERYREWYLAEGDACRAPLALDWRSQGCSRERANHVYTKGPWVLYMLERAIGEEAFWRATRAYLRRYANDLVTTEDFIRTIFDVTGHNVEGFVEQWVEGGGHPVLEVAFEHASTGLLALGFRQVQRTGELVPLFDLLVDVEFHLADGTVTRDKVHLRDAAETFVFQLEGQLSDVVVDPDCMLLCELQVDKSAAMWARQATRPNSAAQWRALTALGPLAGESATAGLTLMSLLRESDQPLLRERAASLSTFEAALPDLVFAATHDPAARVRRAAAEALAELEVPAADRTRLRTHLDSEASPMVRAAIEALLGES